jgi:hypothetical protein
MKRKQASAAAAADGGSRAVAEAAGRVLRPFVRLLLDHGITLPVLEEMLKAAYVTVALEEFGSDGRAPNDSRVSVLTGIHRKDVKRLRASPRHEPPPPLGVSAGGQMIVQWTSRRGFLDARGRPRALPRLRRDGGEASFEALAESVSTDVGPRPILDELLRLGIVRVDERDRVCLEVSALVPREGLEEKAYYFGKNIHDHLCTVAHNLRGQLPPRLERSVSYDDISEASAEVLARAAEQAGMAALNRMNRQAQGLKQRDRRARRGGREMTFGVYFHTAPSGDGSPQGREP